MDFKLPNLGEGIDNATVVAISVKEGDSVEAGQAVMEVETDKASMPVEADVSGTVEKILVKEGDKINVGAAVLSLSGNSASSKNGTHLGKHDVDEPKASAPDNTNEPDNEPKASATDNETDSADASPKSVEFKLPNLGEGIDSGTVVALSVEEGASIKAGDTIIEVETDKANMGVECDVTGTIESFAVKQGDKINVGATVATIASKGAAPKTTAKKAESSPKKAEANGSPAQLRSPSHPATPAHTNGTATKDDTLVAAGPATRRLARELGVALSQVPGSARGNRVTLDDVKGYVKNRIGSGGGGGFASGATVADSFAHPAMPDFSKFGNVERQKVSGIRKKIAENLTVAVRTMPMVTQQDIADITDLEAGRKRISAEQEKGAPKITMTVLAVKAVVTALKEFPNFNSSYDMNAGELVLKQYYHIGIAVDTPRGLVVPVIRDADKKSIRELAKEVTELAGKARDGKLKPDEMRGGCFTITNLGGIGGTAFTPIVNYPEVAILGLSRSSLQPVIRDGGIAARLLMPMSLTYDHRVIDGADGARFTTRLGQLFGDPLRLLMES